MGERAEQIEKEIRQERGELDRNLKELQYRVRDATNWKSQFRKHPGPLLGTAFAIGVAISVVSGRKGNSLTRTRARLGYPPPEASETWKILKTALIGLAAQRLSGVVDQYVPGFQRHYREAESKVRGPAHATG